MSAWSVIQIVVNILAITGLGVLWVRINRPAKEDPRLSKGLQLLQTKISILEDLSDRTDKQVKQLCNLIDQKSKTVHELIHNAESENHRIKNSMEKSLEVARIFEDKIPHEEIIERKNSKKFIEAARLAHKGLSVDEISAQIDLDRSEIEFIIKVNKKKLMFSEDKLPNWARPEEELANEEQQKRNAEVSNKVLERNFSSAFEAPEVSLDKLENLGRKFREVCVQAEKANTKEDQFSTMAFGLKNKINDMVSHVVHDAFASDEVETLAELDFTEEHSVFNDSATENLDWEVAEADIDQRVNELVNRVEETSQLYHDHTSFGSVKVVDSLAEKSSSIEVLQAHKIEPVTGILEARETKETSRFGIKKAEDFSRLVKTKAKEHLTKNPSENIVTADKQESLDITTLNFQEIGHNDNLA